jgi:hypothetical protein
LNAAQRVALLKQALADSDKNVRRQLMNVILKHWLRDADDLLQVYRVRVLGTAVL